jgi:hypothetical protein
MYFCPKCNYSFDISKATTSDNEIDTRKKLDNVNSALKRLNVGKNLSDYVATFTLEELESNKIYSKLSDEDKDKCKVLFQETPTNTGGIMFKCNNCSYSKKIKETIRLYQLNVNSVYSVYRSQDDNKLLCLNPIYPRTNDYDCKNINCITHKNANNKEAVFFREKDSYLTNYICCICYNGWKV